MVKKAYPLPVITPLFPKIRIGIVSAAQVYRPSWVPVIQITGHVEACLFNPGPGLDPGHHTIFQAKKRNSQTPFVGHPLSGYIIVLSHGALRNRKPLNITTHSSMLSGWETVAPAKGSIALSL